MHMNLILLVAIFAEYLASGRFDVLDDGSPFASDTAPRLAIDGPSLQDGIKGVRVFDSEHKSLRAMPFMGKGASSSKVTVSSPVLSAPAVAGLQPKSRFFASSSSDDEDDSSEDDDEPLAAFSAAQPLSDEDEEGSSEDDDEPLAFSATGRLLVPGETSLDLSSSSFAVTQSRGDEKVAESLIHGTEGTEYVVKMFVDKKVGKRPFGLFVDAKKMYPDCDDDDDDDYDDSASSTGSSSSTSSSCSHKHSLAKHLALKLVYAYDDVRCKTNIVDDDGEILCEKDEPIKLMVFTKRYMNMIPFSALVSSDHHSHPNVVMELMSAHIDFWEMIGELLVETIQRFHSKGIVVNTLTIKNLYLYVENGSDSVTSDSIGVAIYDMSRQSAFHFASDGVVDLKAIVTILKRLLDASGTGVGPRGEMMEMLVTMVERAKRYRSDLVELDGINYTPLMTSFEVESSESSADEGGIAEWLRGGFRDECGEGAPIFVTEGSKVNLGPAIPGLNQPLTIADRIFYEGEDVLVVGGKDASGQELAIKFEFILDDHSSCATDNEAKFVAAAAAAGSDFSDFIVRTYFVSEHCEYFLGRTIYDYNEEEKMDQGIRVGTPVRIQIMERLGRKLSDMKMLVKTHLKDIALQGLGILRRIHGLGFVHGDVHGGNFVDSGIEVDGVPIIKAIDFGQSLRYVESSESREYPIGLKTLDKLSISELEEKFPAPKDDLFRWAETLMNIITDETYLMRVRGRKTIIDIIDFKNGFPKSDEYGGSAQVSLIKSFMQAVLNLPYNSKPGDKVYDELALLFQ